jgi:hypothetical protein
MTMAQLSDNLLRYGDYLYDLELETPEGFRRIRVIKLNNKKYVHHVLNGDVQEIKQI